MKNLRKVLQIQGNNLKMKVLMTWLKFYLSKL